jgi:hypothetical protein
MLVRRSSRQTWHSYGSATLCTLTAINVSSLWDEDAAHADSN